MSGPRRILIVNPFGIGDVLFSTPLVRAVRRACPEAYVAYLCNRRTQEILRRNTHLDELFIYEKDELVALSERSRWQAARALLALIRDIRRRRFDLAIDLSLGERYSFLLALFRVPRRIGFDFRRRGRFLTHRFVIIEGYQERHVVEYYGQLLAWLGVRMRDPQLDLATNHEDLEGARQRLQQLGIGRRRRLIGLVPAGGISWGLQANFRRWSKDGFIAVGRALQRRHDAAILVFGEPKDHEVCVEITRAVGESAIDLSGQTTLGQFVSLIAQCDLVISNDGGPIHIAASQQVPTVSIFGPVDPTVYGPYPRTSAHRVAYREDLRCRPCYHQFKLPPCPYERACLTSLEPEAVLEACEETLGRGAS
ncbi:MAG: hypothetical protein HYY91_06420 [Candidatus Omnitrophica bacterium]|nr:hypothetical protein [Candidatus Omnitrophota bacterium]